MIYKKFELLRNEQQTYIFRTKKGFVTAPLTIEEYLTLYLDMK